MRPSIIIIEPGRGALDYWLDMWRYRELLYILAWRDFAVRYKQTAIGVAWAVLRPALTMFVFVAFRRLLGAPPRTAPEPVFVLAAVLPWQLFSSALSESAGSLIGNASLVSKVYFPRMIIPLASIVTSAVDFLITVALLALLMAWYGVLPGPQVVLLPLFIVIAVGFSAGLGLLFCALNVEYRDFRYIVPFIVQFGVFVSPIAFTTSSVPERWRLLYAINPMAGIIDGFRWCLLGEIFDRSTVVMSLVVTIVLLTWAIIYFRRVERGFADVI